MKVPGLTQRWRYCAHYYDLVVCMIPIHHRPSFCYYISFAHPDPFVVFHGLEPPTLKRAPFFLYRMQLSLFPKKNIQSWYKFQIVVKTMLDALIAVYCQTNTKQLIVLKLRHSAYKRWNHTMSVVAQFLCEAWDS